MKSEFFISNHIQSRNLFAFLIILVVAFIIYFNSFQASFQFDDYNSIVQNNNVRNPTKILLVWHQNPTRLLTYLTFALNYSFGGLNVFSYHLVNLLIHIAASFVVYLFALSLFKTPVFSEDFLLRPPLNRYLIALTAGLFFLVHPIQTEAVTYISQRFTSLATLFYLFSVWLYIKFRMNKSPYLYLLSLTCLSLAVITKEICFTLPFTIVLLEILFYENKSWGVTIARVAPFMCVAFLMPLLAYESLASMRHQVGFFAPQFTSLSPWQYFLTEINVLVTYLRLIVAPIGQNLIYDYPISTSLLEIKTMLCCLSLTVLLLIAMKFSHKKPLVSFGIVWFFITLSVESSFIPLANVIFEHRLYLPLAGVSVALSYLILFITKSLRRFALVSGTLLLLLSIGTFHRNEIWKTPLALWTDVLSKSPQLPMAYNNLAMAHAENKGYQESIALFTKSIQLVRERNLPEEFHKLHTYQTNLAISYQNIGQYDSAQHILKKVLKTKPDYKRGWIVLANTYVETSQYKKAIHAYHKALQLDNADPVIYEGLSNIYRSTENYQKARLLSDKAIAIYEQDPHSFYALLKQMKVNWK